MPYPAEHSARLIDPAKYERVRRENDKFGPGIHAIWGVTKDGEAELQAIRFDKTKFSVDEAKAWLKAHDKAPILFEPASDKEASLLCGPDSTTMPVSHEVLEDGVPRKRFRKDLITDGVYQHPKLGWTLDTTPERRARWLAAFNRMTGAGVRVPLPKGHSYDAADNQGYLIGLENDGTTLWGVLEFIGEEAIALAYRTQQVSISINPEFVDGKGTNYGEVIEHVALTPYPVVPGQADFKAIAASLVPPKGDEAMTKEQLDKFRKMLGAGEDLTEDKVLDRIAERFTAHATEKTALDKKVTDLSGEVEGLKAKVAASTKDVKTVDPELLDERAETAEEKIDGLVPKGKITPAVAASLKAALVGPAAGRNTFCLSRSISGTPESVVNAIIKALDMNDPVKLGEQTKSQALSRQVPGDDAPKMDKEVVEQMVGAGGSK